MATAVDSTIQETLALLKRGALSRADLLAQCAERIDRTEPQIRAWVTVDYDTDSPEFSGPLSGIPIAVKDIFDVRGFPTTASSRVLAGTPSATSDAAVVKRLREAGAVIFGKTNTHEFAYGYVSAPTSNPWDPSRIPGGSSGGTAAAVAAGHCLGGIGSDTGGSIRVPAALCGLTGLKPRHGIVALDGTIPLAPALDVAGPLAKDAKDALTLWEVMSQQQLQLPEHWSLGIPPPDALPPLEDEVQQAFWAAVAQLESMASGVTVAAGIPAFEDFDAPRAMVVMPEALRVHRERGWWPGNRHLYSDEVQASMTFAEGLDEQHIEQGRREAGTLSARLRAAVAEAGVLAIPTVPCVAPTHQEAAAVEPGSDRRPIARKLARLPSPVNLANLAAISVPCGFTSSGLPVGLQLIGIDEAIVIKAAIDYQAKTDWHTRRPTFEL